MTSGRTLTGSFVSSAMLTESSKPTIAKKARAVAAVTAPKALCPSAVSKSSSREVSPTPRVSAHAPMAMMMSSPPSPIDRSKASTKLLANARDALEAEVRPEHMTVNVTMNVRRWMPNALWV